MNYAFFASCLYAGTGGFLGAILRFTLQTIAVKKMMSHRAGPLAPFLTPLSATLLANALGCFLLGLSLRALEVGIERGLHPQTAENWRIFFIAGFIGSLTTLSTMVGEAHQLTDSLDWFYGFSYVILSVGLGFICFRAALALGSHF